MNICDKLWANSRTIERFKEHNFPLELANGTLNVEKFRFFIQQDSLYIKHYADAMRLLSDKAPDEVLKDELYRMAQESYELEYIIQQEFFKSFDIEYTSTMQPACLAYSSFLKMTVQEESFIIGLTSLLPCFWVYLENGKYIQERTVENNKYQSWIDTYVSQEFMQQTEWIKSLVEKYSNDADENTINKMKEVFEYSCKLDYKFMDDAYNLVIW